jgi:hypothetical protein
LQQHRTKNDEVIDDGHVRWCIVVGRCMRAMWKWARGWPPRWRRMKTVQVHKKIVMTRSTCLCTLLGCRNESWGPLSTFTTIEVCSETPCLKHPVAALSLNS